MGEMFIFEDQLIISDVKNLLSFCLVLAFLSCEYKTQLPQTLEINSQKDLDEWRCELEGLEVFNGNIYLKPEIADTAANPITDIYDLSAFNFLKKINGELLIGATQINSLSALSQLEEVKSFLIFNNDKLTEVNLPNLESVEQKISFSRNNNLTKISFSGISNLFTLFVLDNPKLEEVSGFNNLTFLIDFFIQRCNLKTINGFTNLENMQNRLDLEFNNMQVAPGSFKNLKSVNQISILARDHDKNFSWLGSVRSYDAFSIAGPINLQEMCPIKSAVKSPNFGLFSWQGNSVKIYTGLDVEKECK